MECPKCKLEQPGKNLECPRCGIVFKKFQKQGGSGAPEPSPGPETEAPPEEEPEKDPDIIIYEEPKTDPFAFYSMPLPSRGFPTPSGFSFFLLRMPGQGTSFLVSSRTWTKAPVLPDPRPAI